MGIQNLIIHEVRRGKTSDAIIKTIKEEENDLSKLDPDLATNLIDLFSKASLHVGEFALDGDKDSEPAFEQKLREYYDQVECLDFLALTSELAEIFFNIISSESLKNVKGGFLVFFQYLSHGKVRLAVAVVNKTKGTDLDADLNLIATQILDLEKLHLGATINITDWNIDLSSRYVRFKKGKASSVTEYFEDFIGCQLDESAAREETKQLKTAIQDFSKNTLKLDADGVDQRVQEAHRFIIEKINNDEEVSLTSLAKRVFPDQNEDFHKYASDECNISETIAIHKDTLKNFQKLSVKTANFSLTFKRELLGNQFTYENGILQISDLPDAFRQELEAEKARKPSDSQTP